MMPSTKKFKNQLNANLIKPIADHLHEDWANLKQLQHSLLNLQTSIGELQSAINQVGKFAADTEKLVDQWQFKSQPRLAKIQEILNKHK